MGHRVLVLPIVEICPTECPLSLIVVGIKAHRGFCHLEGELESFFVVVRPLVVVIVGIGPGEACVGARIVRVDFPRLLEKIARGCVAFAGEFVPLVPASRKVVVGGEAVRVLPGKARDLGLSQFAAQPPDCSDDGPRDVVTNCENALYLPVIAVGPELASRTCINQLRGHAHVTIGALHAALDDVTDVEILAHLPAVGRLVLVGEGGIARHDYQLGKLGQSRDQLLGNSVGKVLLIVRGTHVVEGQNGNGRVFGKRAISQNGIP